MLVSLVLLGFSLLGNALAALPACTITDGVNICLNISSIPVTPALSAKAGPAVPAQGSGTKTVSGSSHLVATSLANPEKVPVANLFDLYLPAQNSGHLKPVLIVHGGCYIFGDKGDVKDAALRFVKAGYAAISMNYHLASDAVPSYPQILTDVQRVIDWIRTSPESKKMGIDPSWLGAYGESAGALFALYMGTRQLAPQTDQKGHASADAVIDFYGRTDLLRAQPAGFGQDCGPEFLHADRRLNPQAFKDASISLVPGVLPAHFFIAHGMADKQVDIWHSRHLIELLRAAGQTDQQSSITEVPGQGHGFSGPLKEGVWSAALDFFARESKAKSVTPH